MLNSFATLPGTKFSDGTFRKTSELCSAPVIAKSCGLRLVTGTPTATVPRIKDPVIKTVSGISPAFAMSVAEGEPITGAGGGGGGGGGGGTNAGCGARGNFGGGGAGIGNDVCHHLF